MFKSLQAVLSEMSCLPRSQDKDLGLESEFDDAT